MQKLLGFILCFLLFLPSFGQNSPFEYLKQENENDKIAHFISKVDIGILKEELKKYGGQIKYTKAGYTSFWIPNKNKKEFLLNTKSGAIYKTSKGLPLSNLSLINNNILPVHQGSSPLHESLDGTGVIVGIIDTDIDYTHPDFKNANGASRILYIWDQEDNNPTNPPQPYNYGQEWSSSSINSGAITYVPTDVHGTNVTGIAASNGLAEGNYKGGAPNSDIVFVVSALTSNQWLQTVADGVDYIFNKADALGKPCVINISMGTYSGSHDGYDPTAQIIDAMIKEKEGRVVVAAAGNAGEYKFHIQHNPTNTDTVFTLFKNESSIDLGMYGSNVVFFEGYADSSNFNDVQFCFSVYRDSIKLGNSSFINIPDYLNGNYTTDINNVYIDSIVNNQNQRLSKVYMWAGFDSDSTYIVQGILDPDSLNGYSWGFHTTGEGRIDIWSSPVLTGTSEILDSSSAEFPFNSVPENYILPDSLYGLVSSFQCLKSVITVANYNNRDTVTDATGFLVTITDLEPGDLGPTSSHGPTRTNYQKPDIASPGNFTFAATILSQVDASIGVVPDFFSSDSLHLRNGGTSMASPALAGGVALMLQACPKLTYEEVILQLISNTKTDNYTGTTPNYGWGYGKADFFNTIVNNQLPRPSLTINSDSVFCLGDSVSVSIPNNYETYLWSNGATTNETYIKETSLVKVVATNEKGCRAISDDINFIGLATPNKPTIYRDGDTLYSSTSSFYQWYFNGAVLLDSTNQSIIISDTGYYQVEIFHPNGCSAFSDSMYINYLYTHINSYPANRNAIVVFPNPAKNKIFVNATTILNVEIRDMLGKIVLKSNHNTIDISSIVSGTYFVYIKSREADYVQKLVIKH